MSQRAEQFTCECGKQFNNRNDLDKHRQTCATAQATGGMGSSSGQRGSASGQQTRGAGGGSSSTNE
jgi:hypothetical protein